MHCRLPLGLLILVGAARVLSAQSAPLPFELAFSKKDFPWQELAAVAPDGEWIAYTVRQAPADVNLDRRYMPNGTPSSSVGTRIFAGPIGTPAVAEDICPRKANCWRPVWSPDGATLAFYSDADGPPRLWVYSRDQKRTRRISEAIVKPKLWIGDEPVWGPRGQELFVPLAPARGGEASYAVTLESAVDPSPPEPEKAKAKSGAVTVTVHKAGKELTEPADRVALTPMFEHLLRENNATLAALALDSGAVRVLAPADSDPRPSVLRRSASGRWISYLSIFKPSALTSQESRMDLAVVPSAGGQVKVVVRDLLVRSDYHGLNYSWHPTEDWVVYLKDDKVWLVEIGAEGPASPKDITAGLKNLAAQPLWFTRDGTALVVGIDVLDERDYGDPRPRSLAVIPLAGGAPSPLRIESGWEYGGMLRANGSTLWQPDEGAVTLMLRETTTGETAFVRYPLSGGTPAVLRRELARFESISTGGRHDLVVARYQNVGTPVDLYRFSADFSAISRISRIEPRLDSISGGTVEMFESIVPLHDGTLGRVRTAVLLPQGAERGDRLPSVVLMYPGSDTSRVAETFGGGNTVTIPTLVLLSRGYAVIYPHLRMGPNREAGNPAREMTDVLLPQVYQAAALGLVDLNRLGIMGQSYGGYGTAAIVSQTNLFRAAVAISGLYDLGGLYGVFGPGGTSFYMGWSEGGQGRMGTHPWANLRRYVDNSPYYQADKIRTPLLLLHGDEDMSYTDAEKLFSALRRLDRTVQLAAYHGQGHVVYSWTLANAADAAERMTGFFDRYLRDSTGMQRSTISNAEKPQ